MRVYNSFHTRISLTHGGILTCSSALHSVLNLGPEAMRTIRYLGNPAPSVDGIDSHLEQTVRILVENTDIDVSGESSEGDTFLHLAIKRPLGKLLVGWLSRKIVTEFDLDHRNAQGKTLLMQQASNTDIFPDWPNVSKNLRALGADFDARVMEKRGTSPRDIGATALHFAAEFCLEKTRYLLSQGASPHAMSAKGHTATDRILEFGSFLKFVRWRKILRELGFDLKAFVREEIDIHADVPWYASNGCGEYVLELFGFKPELDDSTGTVKFLALSEESAQDGAPRAVKEDLSTFDLFDYTEPEHVSSPEFDYESADEDIARPLWTRRMKPPKAYHTKSGAAVKARYFRNNPSQYWLAKPLSTEGRRIRQAYIDMLETDVLGCWTVRGTHEDELREYSYLIQAES